MLPAIVRRACSMIARRFSLVISITGLPPRDGLRHHAGPGTAASCHLTGDGAGTCDDRPNHAIGFLDRIVGMLRRVGQRSEVSRFVDKADSHSVAKVAMATIRWP